MNFRLHIFRAGYIHTTNTNERQTMAYNDNITTGNKKTQYQPIHDCKVCVDAGKSPQECASHYVKDRAGNITCPTLLNQKCLLCGVCGHTASYCKASAKTTTKEPTRELTKESKAPTRIQPQPAKEQRPQCSNKYAILGLLEAEAERVKEQLVVAFPPLDPKPEHSRPSTATKSSTISTWASTLKSPPSPFSQHSEQEEKQQPQQQQQQQRRKPTKPVAIAVSWADY